MDTKTSMLSQSLKNSGSNFIFLCKHAHRDLVQNIVHNILSWWQICHLFSTFQNHFFSLISASNTRWWPVFPEAAGSVEVITFANLEHWIVYSRSLCSSIYPSFGKNSFVYFMEMILILYFIGFVFTSSLVYKNWLLKMNIDFIWCALVGCFIR